MGSTSKIPCDICRAKVWREALDLYRHHWQRAKKQNRQLPMMIFEDELKRRSKRG